MDAVHKIVKALETLALEINDDDFEAAATIIAASEVSHLRQAMILCNMEYLQAALWQLAAIACDYEELESEATDVSK